MERLAFIRMLHQQGNDQSRLPEPLNYTCVLTFHDAIELFLMLAGEHLRAVIPERGNFVARYFDNIDKSLVGTQLTGRKAVGRITDLRNAFKHANTWPGPSGIEQSRADAASFFEENTPKVFGVPYIEIHMADLIPQDAIRQMAKDAHAAEASGDMITAMALLREAVDELFRSHIRWEDMSRSPFSIGPDLRHPVSKRTLRAALTDDRQGNARDVAEQLHTMTKIVDEAQAALRVIATGVEYHAYLRFQLLTPRVDYMFSGGKTIGHHPDYAPSHDDFAYCSAFTVSTAVRLAEIDRLVTSPPWISQSQQ
ncbi:hypothetical protein AB0K34_14010 [Actinomadura sp. NPDC049382]|uniref:hypothetical protein n=1 Tax=Actinomadura sp. NPDC049382 TaxID=3158220 RepID=UPI00343071D0